MGTRLISSCLCPAEEFHPGFPATSFIASGVKISLPRLSRLVDF